MLRVGLFLLTNLAILVVISITFNVLGLSRVVAQGGINFPSLLVMAALLGMGGSIVSLLLSKTIARRSTGAQVLGEPRNQSERWLLDTVARQANAAGIGMPEVAVYQSPAANAFATGANKNAALVAVSTGLLQAMRPDEVEAVLGHEVSHIANGDMVTLSLIQGVVNTFVIALAFVVGSLVDRALSGGRSRGMGPGFWLGRMIAEVVLGFLATLIVLAFSRWREFRADAGGAKLAGREKMIAALQRLGGVKEASRLPASLNAFGINGGHGALARLLMSHPPLAERIQALREGT